MPDRSICDHRVSMPAKNPSIRRDSAHDVLAAEEFGVPAPDPALHRDEAHDVLAAEEFGVPAPDPGLHRDQAHDVLAAEEFVVPAPDPAIGHGPVALPEDPSGISGPHDVLAAEEFAMPAGRSHGGANVSGSRGRGRAAAVIGAAGALVVLLRLRRR
jgi:hypothetical protein